MSLISFCFIPISVTLNIQKKLVCGKAVNFGQKNLSQFVDAFKEFFMIQFLKLNSTAYANINLFASIYDAVDDTISGLIIDRTRAMLKCESDLSLLYRFRYGLSAVQ